MPAAQAFRVLTEFKFEVGAAVASVGGLGRTIDGVSAAAENLQFQLAKVGFGFIGQLGLIGGGLVGTLGKMLQMTDSLEQTEIKFSGIIFANKRFLEGVDDSNSSLLLTKQLLNKIAKDASTFGLNERGLSSLSAATIATVTKAGIQPTQAVDFSRNVLKAAPQLGIDAFQAQGQIRRALLGGASLGDPAFKALAAETQVFAKRFGNITKAAKEFNKLDAAERFQLLNQAFGEFTQSAAILEKNANTISALITRIKQAFFGFAGVLKPLGELLRGPVKEALTRFLTFINLGLRPIFENLTRTLKQVNPSLDNMIIRLQQIRDLAGNFKEATIFATLLTLLPFLFGIGRFIKFIGGGALLTGIGVTLAKLGPTFFKFGFILGRATRFIVQGLGKFLGLVGIFLIIFDILSRAVAIARLDFIKRLPGIIIKFQESMNRIVALIAILTKPFDDVANFFAKLVAPIFNVAGGLELMVDAFKFLEKILISFFATLSGIFTVIIGFIDNLRQGEFARAFDPEVIGKNFDEGIDDFLRRIFTASGQLPSAEQGVSSQITNINKIEINNTIKEKIEPDRIAFSLKEQLLKVSQNPRGARGVKFSLTGAR